MGYSRAGFEVVGVDVKPQPNYPFDFIHGDALEFLHELVSIGPPSMQFDVIHASPPCQAYSAMAECRPECEYPDLIGPTRDLLRATGLPYVIENVEGSPLATQATLDGEAHAVTLCGHMFGLPLYRHRVFESNMPLAQPSHPPHIVPASKAGHWEPGTIISVAGNCTPIALARESMGIDWTNRDELAEAIPPAYAELIGLQLLSLVRARAAA
jgi:DNA (cytosine-5)-methyltransferase 1